MALRVVQGISVVVLLVLVGSIRVGSGTTEADFDAFLRQTTDGWCATHPARDRLQAVVVDVHFRPEPPLFEPVEGTVVAPVGIDLPGAQRVLDVASKPAYLRKLKASGIAALAWEYSGRVHRRMRFRAVALVERPPRTSVIVPEAPTFHDLPADVRPEALTRAADLEEHGLNKCAAFPDWAVKSAGAPPHTAQVQRLVQSAASRVEESKQAEDVCADIRAGRFTAHRAQVAVVMAARELGIPTFGFASATDRQIHLVGTYVDGAGWIVMDVEQPSEGWFTGGAALLTMAPALGGFTASQHDFWSPEGGAYANMQWGVQSISGTQWQGRLAPGTVTDTTAARAVRLSEVCR